MNHEESKKAAEAMMGWFKSQDIDLAESVYVAAVYIQAALLAMTDGDKGEARKGAEMITSIIRDGVRKSRYKP